MADTVKVQWQAYLGRRVAAAVRHGPGAGRRSSIDTSAPPRRAVRRVDTRRGNAARYGDGAVQRAVRPTRATGSRWRWPSTGSTGATSCPTSTSSRACVSPTTARSSFAGRPAPGRRRWSCGPRWTAGRAVANTPARARPAPTYTATPLRITRGSAAATTAPTTPVGVARPRRERAFLNTEELLGRCGHGDARARRARRGGRGRGRRGSRVVRAGRHAAHRRPRGQPGRRLPALQRRRPGRALQRPRHDRRPGQHLPRRRHRCCSPTRAAR